MEKKNKKHERRVKWLFIICGICGVILSVSTYAWFIGMKTVNVSSFDVQVAAIDSLELSLNGKDWANSVEINSDNYLDVNDSNNSNSWGTAGLIPMSSVGVIDKDASRLIMYEKGSFTQVTGGYRVMASRVLNDATAGKEADGYVAFDLFIRNKSGNEYYSENDPLNEEAIYLTPESAVKVADAGANVANSGIENSVRIAFAQIGRVVATTTNQEKVTGITCNGTGDVTGICRDAQIWEPNDTKHVANAIKWYETNCLKRTGETVTADASYEKATEGTATTCNKVEDGKAYKTYAISGVVNYSDNINVYDGEAYNTYTATTSETPETGKLVAFDTFTDTEKNLLGVNRPAFITLAPNSITKVRVYIYLEGQDVDNYDFASLGKKITVAFGFTKEQLYGDDINYTGEPALPNEVANNPARNTATND